MSSPRRSPDTRPVRPAIYAQFGITLYGRVEPKPLWATVYRLGSTFTPGLA